MGEKKILIYEMLFVSYENITEKLKKKTEKEKKFKAINQNVMGEVARFMRENEDTKKRLILLKKYRISLNEKEMKRKT